MSLLSATAKMLVTLLFMYILGTYLLPSRYNEAVQQDYLNFMHDVLGKSDLPRLSELTDGVKVGIQENMDEALKELFNELDTNGDGVIEYKEFQGMTLNSWAAFRSFDLALKNRLQMPSFSNLRQTIRTTVEQNFPDLQLPEELRILNSEASFSQKFRSAAWWYFFFLLYVQCVLGMYENITGFLGFRVFKFKDVDKSKVEATPKLGKIPCLLYDTPLTGFYEKAKMVVFTVSGLAALRLFQIIFFVMIGMVAVNISVMIPNRYWKAFWMQWVGSFCIHATMFSWGYYRVGMEGKVCDKSEAKLMVGNHTAVVEILIMFGLSFPSFISAVENEAVPMFAGVVRACNAVLVDRLDKNSKRKTMEEIVRRCKDPDAERLMIFPEGTLNNSKALFTFKPGAFEPGMPVQPVCFKYPFKHFNPCWTGEAAGGNDVGEVLWRGLCQFVNRLEVKVLPVYVPNEAEKADKFLYSENVRRLIASQLECGISDCRYEDYVALYKRYIHLKIERRTEEGRRPKPRFWFPFYRPVKIDMDEVMSPYSDDNAESVDE